mmetsp:Transcript_37799/g.65313  ORF Transcript_37799/g.65313 Transcript_37799/m.65313 type:complete len:812 (-) Transcript_37799:9-2444(-)|eukprot:CAMPEP_0185000492 /NCGR_PEP_ID=MMETSP1098-20130426/68313_1 /TAXON_ID=89044 /ORGANISM="Spumella elongata, Strain CCAP 955/1" /LENGTH=811 /DNA_ID=CAMNT_0027527665 /DNA_START=45 /DNA_END=2480 /DNA_ORIENTATION=+
MTWKAWLCLVLSSGSVSMLLAFDMYPWGKYDFKEYSDDLLDALRENVQLKVWESTLSNSLSKASDSLLLKNSEGNTYEMKLKSVGKALTVAPIQTDDFMEISETLKTNCALHTEGYWSYEWCHTKEVRQFHMEQKGNVLHREPDWSLGKAGRTVTIREKHVGDTTAEAKTRRITKIIEYFENGQRCDETGEGRATEVHIVCCEGSAVKNYISAAAYYASVDGTASHNLKLPAATIASITEPDLCAYEVTVCSPLMCKRPSEVLSTASASQVALKDAPSAQLASVMKFINSTCLSKQEDWWTYELCFNSGLRQVHYDIQQVVVEKKVTQKQLLLSQFQLGLAPVELYSDENALKKSVSGSDRAARSLSEKQIIQGAGMVTPAFRMRGREPNYLRLEFVDGTPCDLDNVNRSAVVDLYCGNKNRFVGIWEDSTCHYHVQAELSVLCSFSDFVPLKENTTTVEFAPFESESVEETLTTAVFSVEHVEASESAEASTKQLTGTDHRTEHSKDAEPVVEEHVENFDAETAPIAKNHEQAHDSPEDETNTEELKEETHTENVQQDLQKEARFVGEEEWEHPGGESSVGESQGDEEQKGPKSEDASSSEESGILADGESHSSSSSSSGRDNDNIGVDSVGAEDHHEPEQTEESPPAVLETEHQQDPQDQAPSEIEPSDQPLQESAHNDEKIPSADVLNLVMQLEHAATELDMPLNLSRSAMMELIESAIAQAVVEGEEEGVVHGAHQAGEGGEGEGAPAVVLKYAFIVDDGEETVVVGSGEAHTGENSEDEYAEEDHAHNEGEENEEEEVSNDGTFAQ